MVANPAGGYVFSKNHRENLADFIITGTAGGTYYVNEREHTLGNLARVNDAVAADPLGAAVLAHECLTGFPQRAPRPHGGLYVLAYAHAKGGHEARLWIEDHAWEAIRTSFHRSMFWGYYRQVAGKPRAGDNEPTMPSGRAARRLFSSLLLRPDVDDLAFSIAKGNSRKTSAGEDVSAHDILRKFHPFTADPRRNTLFAWIGGKVPDVVAAEVIPVIGQFTAAQGLVTSKEAVAFIAANPRTPWEFIPSELRDAAAWRELAGTTGMTALVRNLALMTRNGAITPMAPTTAKVVDRLSDGEAVRRSRLHPADLWLAQQAYAAGVSQPHPGKPPVTWQPVNTVLGALDRAWEAAFGSVTPTGKRLLVAVDCSGSMGSAMHLASGAPIGNVYQVALVMAMMLARAEPNVHVIEVDTSVHPSLVNARTSIAEIGSHRNPHGGGTDMALPFLWATREKVCADGIVVFTDNETWAGGWHASEALEAYRRAVNPACKVVVVSMTANGRSIGDPRDEGVLNVAGLDATIPALVAGFIR